MHAANPSSRFKMIVALALLGLLAAALARGESAAPGNPRATDEARALLKFLHEISGKKTLTGQHEVLGRMSVVSDRLKEITGDYPAVWGCDFGFSDERHDIDNIKYRSGLVAEIRKQHASGAIITMTYHQANPTMGEPCLFEGGIISKMTDAQWKELLTPGTELHRTWERQMDIVATLLTEVRDAHIPVLFRPYHEMNGKWFWWGGRPGPDGAAALYRQVYRYFTEHHRLDNLLWVWSPDKPWPGVEDFFPGHGFADVLACDIYPQKDKPGAEVYPQEWYDRMVRLAGEKPLALGEFSKLPDPKLFERQPRWVWMLGWSKMVLAQNSPEEIRAAFQSERRLTRSGLLNARTTR